MISDDNMKTLNLSKEERAKYNEYMRLYYHKNKERAKALMQNYVDNHRGKIREIKKRYYDKNIEQIKARKRANTHIEMKGHCEICNNTHHLEKHHWRYDKPLLVATLCTPCHGIQHSRRVI